MDRAAASYYQSMMNDEVAKLQSVNKQLQSLLQQRQKCLATESENEMVAQEFKLIKDPEATPVYKLVGQSPEIESKHMVDRLQLPSSIRVALRAPRSIDFVKSDASQSKTHRIASYIDAVCSIIHCNCVLSEIVIVDLTAARLICTAAVMSFDR